MDWYCEWVEGCARWLRGGLAGADEACDSRGSVGGAREDEGPEVDDLIAVWVDQLQALSLFEVDVVACQR